MNAWRMLLVWLVFCNICFGLGYATLSRYDPSRAAGTPDASYYARLVRDGPHAVHGGWQYRVLVPGVAKPFSMLAQGRLGTWNPLYFGLLVANALFAATTATLLMWIGLRLGASVSTALLGAALYLLNFDTVNFQLAALVDTGETLAMMLLASALMTGTSWALPFIGVLGASAKETFVPLSAVFAIAWWVVEARRERVRLGQLVAIGLMVVSSMATIAFLHWIISGEGVWIWNVTGRAAGPPPFERDLVYVFLWLLPLGVMGLKSLPRPWVGASLAAVVCVFVLAGYYRSGGGSAARASFNMSGPMLSLSAAMWLSGRTRERSVQPSP